MNTQGFVVPASYPGGKLLAQTKVDQAGNLTAESQPATGATITKAAFVSTTAEPGYPHGCFRMGPRMRTANRHCLTQSGWQHSRPR